MSSAGFVDGVQVLWRPGCPFCTRLRRGLRRHGVITTEVDIWKDPGAAERVRAVTGGDETVPTVFVGSRALVNPSARAVVAAIECEFPDRAQEMMAGPGDSARRTWWSRLFGSGHGR
ncbi:MAG: NrdH-redoxin [Actinomycetia bacterium]|nr:NrdH-redoxin [Actinomycetes bacterium]MCH9702662.1 NrdH-redoxin [Actinomycetes bacterium]MCH9762345.1 NrdH-redoxin [Actinomycetes bacterium]